MGYIIIKDSDDFFNMVEFYDIERLILDLNISKIYIDVDGVILKSKKVICKLLNDRYKTQVKEEDVISYDFKQIKSDIEHEELEDLFDSDDFFNMVEFYDGVIDFIKKYKDKITIITKGRSTNLFKKGILFEDNGLEDIKFIGLPLNKSKGCIDMSDCMLIDDYVLNLNESNAMVKILFKELDNDCEYQKDWFGLTINRWTNE